MTASSGVPHRPAHFNIGGIPNIVQFGIHEAARNRQGRYFDGARRRTYARFIMTLEIFQGKGFPDVATRALVKTLANNLPEAFEFFHPPTTPRLTPFAL